MAGVVLSVLIALSALVGVWWAPRVRGTVRAHGAHPGFLLLVVVAAIYLNQVLFTVYVSRMHGGDASFIARYLPSGWFDLADLDALAKGFPAPELLAITVLRVQAFLELPFVLLAYLLICCWLGSPAYERALRLVWPAAVSYTAVFCLIEAELANPYTGQDIVIRVVSLVVTGVALSRWPPGGPTNVATMNRLVAFIASVGAVGYLVLVVYDTALLYNLGHLPRHLPGVLVATAVLVVARGVTRLLPGRPLGPSLSVVLNALHWLVAMFFVPALAVRYGMSFGALVVAALAGLLVVGAVFVRTLRSVRRPILAGGALAIAVAGAAAAASGGYLAGWGYPESRLLCAVLAFFVALTMACGFIDRSEGSPGGLRSSQEGR